MNGDFIPTYSTNNIWRDDDMLRCMTLDLEDIESDIAALETGKANVSHTHSEYESKYDKPSTGIPKTDLASDVQSSLDKADSAIQSYTETDPTVPAWAKATSKPTYTASEVGALPTTTILADLTDDATHRTVTDTEKATWNAKSTFSGSYNDLTDKPTIPSTSDFATVSYVDNKLAGKVDIADGKGLSSNDYTSAEKTKLAGIATGANNYTLPTATSSRLGGVKIGSNITVSSGTISLAKANVTSALGYTPFNSSNVIPKSKGGTGADFSNIPANAIIRNSGSGGSDLYYFATADGACYATSANGYPTFGTLPVAQGGTGETTAWINGTVSSLNSTTITSYQFAVFSYLNKAFIRLNVLLGSALDADEARYVVMPSTVSTAHTALSCFNIAGYDIHCGMATDSGIYVINCGTASMPSNVRLYIAGWYSI